MLSSESRDQCWLLLSEPRTTREGVLCARHESRLVQRPGLGPRARWQLQARHRETSCCCEDAVSGPARAALPGGAPLAGQTGKKPVSPFGRSVSQGLSCGFTPSAKRRRNAAAPRDPCENGAKPSCSTGGPEDTPPRFLCQP